MPEPVYKATSFRIGKVKSLFEEQGYGFISATNRETFADLFFHYKNLRSPKIMEKDLVLFQTMDSKKHPGKQEAANVIVLTDVIDFGKLLQLYLKYGFTELSKQLCTLTADDLGATDIKIFLDAIISNELAPNPEKKEVLKVRRFIKVLKNQPCISRDVVRDCLKTILKNNPLILGDVFFDVYKTLYGDPVISSLNINVLELYGTLSEELKIQHFENLTLAERFAVKNIETVDSGEAYKNLLTLLVANGEDAAENWRSIGGGIILAPRYIPLLWAEGIITDFPQAALAHHIRGYDATTRDLLLAKMSIDEQISIFPFTHVSDQVSYNFLKSFLLQQKNPVTGFEAFRIAGLTFEPVYYLQSLSDRFITLADADLSLIKSSLRNVSQDIHRKMIAVLGWRSALSVFEEQLSANQYETLKLILTNGDFTKERSIELNNQLDIQPGVVFNLWEQGLISLPTPAKLAAYFIQTESPVLADHILQKTIGYHEQIFREAIQLYINDKSRQTEKVPLRLLKAIKMHLPQLHGEAMKNIQEKSNEWVKVYLWLYDHSEDFDFLNFAPYFITLSSADQKRFIKKIFLEMKQDPLSVSIWEIIRLKDSVVSPELARAADGVGQLIDFTVYVVLQAIEDLSAKSVTKPEAIYKIIGDQIRSPQELLVLNGFFDKCQGRLSIDKSGQDDGEVTFQLRNERGDIPKDVLYCEGRKATLKGTNTPAVCEKIGMEFWWCRNGKCYGACITPNAEWHNFTLIDFLEIAGIEYKREDYEIFLGYVNKVNKFLKHMICRSCNHILKPVSSDKSNNYGFYRVSSFSCQNEKCKQNGEQIYLTHCINGYCNGVIDSRESVKCRSSEDTVSKSGWYICNDCLACCTSEAIEKRRYIFGKTGQVYSGQDAGHRDKGVICCPKCGSEMNGEEASPGDYQRVLDWFIKNRITSGFIQNSGQRKDGKYWFLVQAPVWDAEKLKEFKKKLYKYAAIGFNVPDIRQEKDSYLVAEPYHVSPAGTTRVLTCPNGDYQVELLTDYERYFAMSKYHTQVHLPTFKIP
jgi:cold shock CspA family protein